MVAGGYIASEGVGLTVSVFFQDSEQTIAFIPGFVTPLSLFAGLVIDLGSIPKILSPFKYISFFKFMYEGLILNEFDNINDCQGDLDICNIPANEMSFDGGVQRIKNCLLFLAILAVTGRLITAGIYVISWRKFYRG